jgi:hypothetical protein
MGKDWRMYNRKWSALLLLALWLSSNSLFADLREAREFLRLNQPEKAAAALHENPSKTKDDPWQAYNTAVIAYAARDYPRANEIWQELAARQLPPALRDQVWIQIGNVSFRQGESLEASAPEDALPQWEQSREAYRIVLSARPRDKSAAHNMKVVELKLAKLHARFGDRLYQESQKKPIQEAIEKLQAARDHHRLAQDLDPANEQFKSALLQTERQLSGKFMEKGSREEKKADAVLAKSQPGEWETNQAVENLNTALADFQEAFNVDSQNSEAAQAEKRVKNKLAALLTKQGRYLQGQARAEENDNIERAIERYEESLGKFEEALSTKAGFEDAAKGEKEVKEALEKLHLKEGDRLAEDGRAEVPSRPDQAAEKMLDALGHYQEARSINPENPVIPPKIERLQKELPDLLVSLGKKEQKRAADAEPKSVEKAVAHLEKAATSFEMAQELDQKSQEAKQGQDKVQQDLARLRDKMSPKPGEKGKEPGQNPSKQKQDSDKAGFQSLLDEVKNPEKQREYDESRRHQPQKYDPSQNRNYKNW